jgi:hypothetical protein
VKHCKEDQIKKNEMTKQVTHTGKMINAKNILL